MKRLIATGVASGALLFAVAAGPVVAYPPVPVPDNGGTSTGGTTITEGDSIEVIFGNRVPFQPGTTVTITSTCVAPDGTVFQGPSTTVTANAQGLAIANLSFTRAGVCTITATGLGQDGQTITSSITLTVLAKGGGGGGGEVPKPVQPGTGTGGLAVTGASNNTLMIAAIGGGLLLAGVGAVAVARRRESPNV